MIYEAKQFKLSGLNGISNETRGIHLSVRTMRGVDWVSCYQDPLSRQLSNHWLALVEPDIFLSSRSIIG